MGPSPRKSCSDLAADATARVFEFVEREKKGVSTKIKQRRERKKNHHYHFLLFLSSPYLVGPVTMQVSPSIGPPISSIGGTDRRRKRCGVCLFVFSKEEEKESG